MLITNLDGEKDDFNYCLDQDFISGFNIDFKDDLFTLVKMGKLNSNMIDSIIEWFIYGYGCGNISRVMITLNDPKIFSLQEAKEKIPKYKILIKDSYSEDQENTFSILKWGSYYISKIDCN